MSILIKGMEMPTRCFSCPMCDVENAEVNCAISHGSYIEYREIDPNVAIQGRPSWCPIVEIPCDYDKLLKAARAMHTWIFLHSGNEELAYKACGLSDEMNAFLGYSGSLTLTI